MHTIFPILNEQLKALCEGDLPAVTLLSNASALLMEEVSGLNWAGFYLTKGETLYLGPFQGKVACMVIPYGKGVCGTAAITDTVQRVDDVHTYPGHIACDSASRSEIVLPLHLGAEIYGVLDIDSPRESRFSAADQEGLVRVCKILEKMLSTY